MQKHDISQISLCDNSKISHRLRELQGTLTLTQEEMAQVGGRKRITYAEYVREQNPKMPGADFIANLVLNTGVNANWLLTGQGEMFSPESNAVEPGMQALWAAYQKLGESERALLVAVAKVFVGSGSR